MWLFHNTKKVLHVLVLFLTNAFSETSVQRNSELGKGTVLELAITELKW